MKHEILKQTPKISLEVDIDEVRVILHGLKKVVGSECEKLCDVRTLKNEVQAAVDEVLPPRRKSGKK